MEGMSNYSLADLAAVTGNKEEGFGGGMWIFFLFILLLFTGGGFGGLGRGAAAAEISNDFMYSNLNNQIGTGFTQVTNQNFGIQKDLCQGFGQIQSDIAACCCATQKEILVNRYEADKNTCAITNAIHADGEKTRALMVQNEIQALRDRAQSAELVLAQANQTNVLIERLKNCPIPSYPVCGNIPFPYPCQNPCTGHCSKPM